MRILGGAVGVVVATNVLNNTIKSTLVHLLPPEAIDSLLEDVSAVGQLSPYKQAQVRAAFGSGFEKQLVMVLGTCAIEVLALVLMWERKSRKLA